MIVSMKIGVFDSGVGGQSFIAALKKRFPSAHMHYIEDKENLPYGDKTPKELLTLTLPLFHKFETEQCDAVLVACNTVTTTIIESLREKISIPLVGVEPMIKPASQRTRSNIFAVCATPATLASKRYAWLKQEYAQNCTVLEPDCSQWAYMIEHNRKNELQLEKLIQEIREKHADILVLGCTHYHWIEEELQELASPDIKVIQPIEPVLNQLERVLAERR